MLRKGLYSIEDVTQWLQANGNGNGEEAASNLHVVGVDPGKHEIIVATSLSTFKPQHICNAQHRIEQRMYKTIRLTRRQREKEMGSVRMTQTLLQLRNAEVYNLH